MIPCPTSFKLKILWIRVLKGPPPLRIRMCKGPQLLNVQHEWRQERFVSIVESQVTLPSSVPIDVDRPPQLQERLHHQTSMEALPRPKLNKTMLEEEWTKWLWRKLRSPHQSMVNLSSILFRPNRSLLSFLFCSLESRGEIPVKGVVLSQPKISNFGMWLKFTKF
jgi:hypothetical protein